MGICPHHTRPGIATPFLKPHCACGVDLLLVLTEMGEEPQKTTYVGQVSPSGRAYMSAVVWVFVVLLGCGCDAEPCGRFDLAKWCETMGSCSLSDGSRACADNRCDIPDGDALEIHVGEVVIEEFQQRRELELKLIDVKDTRVVGATANGEPGRRLESHHPSPFGRVVFAWDAPWEIGDEIEIRYDRDMFGDRDVAVSVELHDYACEESNPLEVERK